MDLSFGVLCLEGLWDDGLHVVLRCELWCLYFALGVCPREPLPCANGYWDVGLKLVEGIFNWVIVLWIKVRNLPYLDSE
jgi:hypothetical protein